VLSETTRARAREGEGEGEGRGGEIARGGRDLASAAGGISLTPVTVLVIDAGRLDRVTRARVTGRILRLSPRLCL
jgi:uncharacterized spore protein YtfJ